MRRLEFLSIFLLIVSFIVCREAYELSLGQPGLPGLGLFPFLLGVSPHVSIFSRPCVYGGGRRKSTSGEGYAGKK